METLIFPGGYQDQAGYETIRWRVEGSRRHKYPSLDIFTTIRGIDLWSTDFDSLEPVNPSHSRHWLPRLTQLRPAPGCPATTLSARSAH